MSLLTVNVDAERKFHPEIAFWIGRDTVFHGLRRT